MDNQEISRGVSRRRFLKGIGSGIVGSTILPGTIDALPYKQKNELTKAHQGKQLLSLTVNSKPVNILVEPSATLAEIIRNQLKLTGTKIVCNHGECGACTVLIDGEAFYSCHILALDVQGKQVTTIEGLMQAEKLHPIQEAFIEHDGLQCGFCTPGQIMTARALLNKHQKPTKEQVKTGMAGNICRCSAYPKIVDSVLAAAEKLWK